MSILMTMTLAVTFGTVCAAGLCAFVLRIIPAVEKVSGEMKTSQSST